MNVIPTETEIHAYVDDRLDDADRARVEAWLARHPDRFEEVRAWQRDAQQLRAALGGLPGQDDQPTLDPSVIRAHRRHRMRARLSLAAMLVVTLGIGGIGGWQARDMNAALAEAPMADALQAYRMFALDRPVQLDVTQERAGDMQVWLDQHFQQATRLPNLQAAGFHPIGGRFVATGSGPAAMVLYEDSQGNAISFYIRPPSSRDGALPRGQRREGQLATAYWSGNGYNYALVSHADGPDLRVIRDASLSSSI